MYVMCSYHGHTQNTHTHKLTVGDANGGCALGFAYIQTYTYTHIYSHIHTHTLTVGDANGGCALGLASSPSSNHRNN